MKNYLVIMKDSLNIGMEVNIRAYQRKEDAFEAYLKTLSKYCNDMDYDYDLVIGEDDDSADYRDEEGIYSVDTLELHFSGDAKLVEGLSFDDISFEIVEIEVK